MPENILIVDDDEMILVTFKAILEIEGYNVITALDSDEALSKIPLQNIDMAILDYNLPGMNGIELGYCIKDHTPATEIIFISGSLKIHELAEQQDYSVLKAFSKPIDIESLLSTINSEIHIQNHVNDIEMLV